MGASSQDTSAEEQAAAPKVTAAAAPLKQNNKQFTVDRKAYDPLFRPFHRLNARTYDKQVDVGPTPSKIGPTGKGRDCGCRNRGDFKSSALTGAVVGALLDSLDSAVNKALPGSKDLREFLEKQFNGKGPSLKQRLTDFLSNLIEGGLFGGFLRFIPSWVPVNRVGFGPTFDATNAHNVDAAGKEAEVEVEGRLVRSYQTHHHRPYTQWSRYYQWAFHVSPSVGFAHLVRRGVLFSDDDTKLLNSADNDESIFIYSNIAQADSLATTANLECLLDIGAFSQPPGDAGQVLNHPGIFYEKTWPFWPQHGDWFWAAGRYVYDCTHVTPSKEKNPDDPDAKTVDVELHPSLINPVKAFATARFEGVLFDEADEPLPAMRFSFFSCRKGGYYDFDGNHLQFGTTNYEFAVDLPPAPSGDVSYDIGEVDDFALNTLMIRPRLLQKIEFAPYGSLDKTVDWHNAPPSIQVVRPTDGSLPRMVKVTVPMDTVPVSKDGYGFTISFAWLAPGVPTTVKKVTVKLDQMTFNNERKDLRMSIAVNGRMVFVPTAGLSSKTLVGPSDVMQQFPDSKGIVLFVIPEKGVRISAHGSHRRGFGEFIEENKTVDPARPSNDSSSRTSDRRLAVGGIFNFTKKQEDDIKKLAQQKLKDVIPPQLLGRFKKVEEALDDDDVRKLLDKAISDLVGQRRLVQWEKDVDFQESDPAKKDEIACAVAREMSVFPVDAFNVQNTPMGFVEFLGSPAGTFPGDQTRLDVKAMLASLQSTGSAITTVDFNARPARQVEDGGFIVFQVNPGDVDYVLRITATIADPDPPT